MRRLSVFVLVLAFGVGAVATLGNRIRQDASFRVNRVNKNASRTTNGAFRDGLYQGELAATRGSEPHIATGRWAADQDRASFTEGYQQGYAESLAGSGICHQQLPSVGLSGGLAHGKNFGRG